MLAIIEGVFMGASPKSRTNQQTGNVETSVSVDIYQPSSPANNKTISVKVPGGENIAAINEKFKLGTAIKCTATLSAFQGNLYATHVDGIVKPF